MRLNEFSVGVGLKLESGHRVLHPTCGFDGVLIELSHFLPYDFDALPHGLPRHREQFRLSLVEFR